MVFLIPSAKLYLMRILLVEDEPTIANFIRQGLTEAGYAVDVARDGQEGLNFALAADYDVLVLDIMLPGTLGKPTIPHLKPMNCSH